MVEMNQNGDRPVRVLGIGGSMRRESQSRALLQAILAMAEAAGAETILADVRELHLPIHDPDLPLPEYRSRPSREGQRGFRTGVESDRRLRRAGR